MAVVSEAKAARTTRSVGTSDPPILRFKAKLTQPLGAASTATGVVLPVPPAIGERLRGNESAEGAINGHPFRAKLEHAAGGGCTIRLNQAMLRGSAAGVGDSVQVALLGPEPVLRLPIDLRRAMAASSAATALWSDMSDLARRDYVRWVESTKSPQTRARRIERTVEQLAEGKRRPCCVDTYEYAMSRIDPDWRKRFKR